MKRAFAAIICALVLWLSGCANFWHQPGETADEGHRRHMRNLTVNQQNLSGDIDRALLADKPSTLTEQRVD